MGLQRVGTGQGVLAKGGAEASARTLRHRLAPILASMALLAIAASVTEAQVVRFRMETTDSSGSSLDSVHVGDEFQLRVYAEDLRMQESGGVFAGYLDISYDASLAVPGADITFGDIYQNGKNSDLSAPGLFNDIGAFSSNGDFGIDPIGVGEHLLLSVPMQALAVGDLTFVGADAQNSPLYDVLVYNLNDVVKPSDIDFGNADVKIDFGQAMLRVQPIPEPTGWLLATLGLCWGVTRLRIRPRW